MYGVVSFFGSLPTLLPRFAVIVRNAIHNGHLFHLVCSCALSAVVAIVPWESM